MNDLAIFTSDTFVIEKRAHALAMAESLEPPEDKPTVERALNVRTELLNTVAAIEGRRKQITDPLVAAQKALIAKERELTAKLSEYVGEIDGAIGQYHARIQAENAKREAVARLEAAEIAAAEAESGLDVRATPALVVHVPVADVAVIPTRKVPRLVIDDLTKIPRNFFDLNETKLKAFLVAENTVEGAHIEFEQRITKGRG